MLEQLGLSRGDVVRLEATPRPSIELHPVTQKGEPVDRPKFDPNLN